jgi:hypothetical protein
VVVLSTPLIHKSFYSSRCINMAHSNSTGTVISSYVPKLVLLTKVILIAHMYILGGCLFYILSRFSTFRLHIVYTVNELSTCSKGRVGWCLLERQERF